MEQTTYCAFLRGVNVNGRTMRMGDVCEAFARAGVPGAAAVLASGNLVVRSALDRAPLRAVLEGALLDRFQTGVRLFLKDAQELAALLANNPFSPDPDYHAYVYLCEPDFSAVLMDGFAAITPAAGEEAALRGGAFYWRVRKGGTLDAGFSKALGRRNWRERFTSRNINTIEKALARMRSFEGGIA